MGKRLPKSALLEEIRAERDALDSLIASLKPRQLTVSGVTGGGWSVKDILGHLIGWQKMNLTWFEAGERGEISELPAPGLTWKDTPKLNALIYAEHRRRSLSAVRKDYESYHRRMLELIDQVPDADLVKVGRYIWAGKTWSLSDYIRANTASHYRWARNHIRKWARKQLDRTGK